MAAGRKTGGRTVGTPNRRTKEAQALLERVGCDPLDRMARLAQDPKTPIELQVKLLIELAGYSYPKIRAADIEPPAEMKVVEFNELPPDEQASMRRSLAGVGIWV